MSESYIPRGNSYRHFSIFIFGVALLLGGCFVPIKYDASVPREVPTGFKGSISKQTIRLELPELILSAQIQAYDWDGQYLLKPLGVWLELNARNGGLKLDPQYVTLKADQEPDIQAVSFLGPASSWESPRALAAGCGPRGYRTGIGISRIAVSQESVMAADNTLGIYRPSVGPVSIKGKNCFMFWFDTYPTPDHIFILSIDGITIKEKKVSVPKIYFHKGALTTLRGIP